MKQKKLINDEEESLGTDPIEDKVSEENEHYMDDFYQDYRSLKASVDYNDEEYRHASALNEKIYQVFHESRWCALGPNKKIPKDLIPFIFQEMFEATAETDFTMVEKFVAVCDFMNVNYQKAYELIHMKYREDIVSEMDKKFGILSKRKIKKIF